MFDYGHDAKLSYPLVGIQTGRNCLLFQCLDSDGYGFFSDNASKTINCYVWKEGDKGRGTNEIVSCFYIDLEKRVNLDEGSRIGNIVFISDNCAGQNKNRTMIRFCNWLK